MLNYIGKPVEILFKNILQPKSWVSGTLSKKQKDAMKQSIVNKFVQFIKPPIISILKDCHCLQNTPASIKECKNFSNM